MCQACFIYHNLNILLTSNRIVISIERTETFDRARNTYNTTIYQ